MNNWWSELQSPAMAALMRGRVFEGGNVFNAVANLASVSFHIVGGTDGALLDVVITCVGEASVQPVKGSTYTAAGTALTMFNRNLASLNTPQTTMFHTPTINVAGTNLTPQIVEGTNATGVGGARVGAEASDKYGILLPSGEDILYTITNNSGAAMDIGVQAFSLEFVPQ